MFFTSTFRCPNSHTATHDNGYSLGAFRIWFSSLILPFPRYIYSLSTDTEMWADELQMVSAALLKFARLCNMIPLPSYSRHHFQFWSLYYTWSPHQTIAHHYTFSCKFLRSTLNLSSGNFSFRLPFKIFLSVTPDMNIGEPRYNAHMHAYMLVILYLLASHSIKDGAEQFVIRTGN